MELSPCEFDDAAAKDMERWYLKKKEQGNVDGAQNPCLDKHVPLSPPTSEPICTRGAYDHLIVGQFYEIDHSKLPPKCPDHLKFIWVVMVSDMGELQVSLRYPSIHSLRTQFSNANFGKPDKKKMPALDEKYVMGSEFASNVLCRRIPSEEVAERRNSWNFWIASSEENGRDKSPALFTDEAMDLVSKKGSCWSQLKFTGMMQWGKRRPVRFLGRHEKNKLESLSGSTKETGVDGREQNEREERTERKRKKGEEKEPMNEGSCEVMTTRKSKRNQNESSSVQKSKKSQHGKQNQLVVNNKKKRKISIDRWSAERYKLAEENMLKVMRAKGAVFGKPILRPALRSEARKLIGDTGLLDHLLKHMAGKVAPGGTERFRRRHNAEGAMEYWLESADLINIRREAGVQDPYWTPPPGWMPGDNPSQDPICARELREIKEEMSKLKHDMQQLVSKKKEEELATLTRANSCLSNNLNLDNEGSLVPVQEMYKELVNKKSKIEEQLKDISLALNDLEEQLVMLKPRGDQEPTSESVTPPALLPAPTTVVARGTGGETKEEEQKHKKKETKSGELERSDEDIQSRTGAEDKAAKIERLKSGFRICRPQGTFIWPKMAIVSPHHSQDVVQLEDHIAVPITPSSASSSTTIPEPPLKPQHVATPSSPVKPLAERRPVSTATLTHVTMSSFSPFLSPPPSLGTPPSSKTENPPLTSLINLNEAPPTNDSSFCRTPTYQPSLATVKPHNAMEAAEKEGVEIRHYELQKEKEKEKENSSSLSSPQMSDRHGWWHLALASGCGLVSEASEHII